jgi:hypothetical protein
MPIPRYVCVETSFSNGWTFLKCILYLCMRAPKWFRPKNPLLGSNLARKEPSKQNSQKNHDWRILPTWPRSQGPPLSTGWSSCRRNTRQGWSQIEGEPKQLAKLGLRGPEGLQRVSACRPQLGRSLQCDPKNRWLVWRIIKNHLKDAFDSLPKFKWLKFLWLNLTRLDFRFNN